jgi:hypothetical protein
LNCWPQAVANFDHLSAGLTVECSRDSRRHLIRGGEKRAIGDMCVARSHARHRMAKQSGDRQLGKPHFGGRSGEAVQHMDRKSRGVAV